MDIAQLLESHRRYMLESAKAHVDLKEFDWVGAAIEHDHDRATTKTLLDLYRKENAVGTAALTQTPPVAVETPVKSRQIKPGSKRARDRAAKAVATKQRKAAAASNGGGQPADTVELSPATHLTPIGGGAA